MISVYDLHARNSILNALKSHAARYPAGDFEVSLRIPAYAKQCGEDCREVVGEFPNKTRLIVTCANGEILVRVTTGGPAEMHRRLFGGTGRRRDAGAYCMGLVAGYLLWRPWDAGPLFPGSEGGGR